MIVEDRQMLRDTLSVTLFVQLTFTYLKETIQMSLFFFLVFSYLVSVFGFRCSALSLESCKRHWMCTNLHTRTHTERHSLTRTRTGIGGQTIAHPHTTSAQRDV